MRKTNVFCFGFGQVAESFVNKLIDEKKDFDLSVTSRQETHQIEFNNIKINDSYAHTNYFKGGDTWTNNWFTWEGTGNKTGIRTSNRSHFDYKWENGKIVEMNCYFDTTALNMELAAQ